MRTDKQSLKKRRVAWLLLAGFLVCISAEAQVRFNQTQPVSVRHASLLSPDRGSAPIAVEKRVVELSDEQEQSRKDLTDGVIALPVETDWGLRNSGSWQELGDKGRLWRLEVEAPGTSSLNFMFEEFYLPEGASLTIYNEDRSLIMGPFTAAYNKPHGRFSTHLFYSDNAIIEYFEPRAVVGEGQLRLERIGYGVEEASNETNASADRSGGLPLPSRTTPSDVFCTVNANCPEGNGLERMKRAVCNILEWKPGQSQWIGFSGTLVNNGNEDCDPLVLTAGHTIPTDPANLVSDHYVFRYNYLRTGCAGTDVDWNEVIDYCGAQWVMNLRQTGSEPDFGILRMENAPVYKEYFAGWSNWDPFFGQPLLRILGHPAGNPMKVYTPNGSPQYWGLTFIRMYPMAGQKAYGGLSGAPFINSDDPDLHILSVVSEAETLLCPSTFIQGDLLSHAWIVSVAGTPDIHEVLNPGGIIQANGNGDIVLAGRERHELCGQIATCTPGFVNPAFTGTVDNCTFTFTDITAPPAGYAIIAREWSFNGQGSTVVTGTDITFEGMQGVLNTICMTIYLEDQTTKEVCRFTTCRTLSCSGQDEEPAPCQPPPFNDTLFYYAVGENCYLEFTPSYEVMTDPNVVSLEWNYDGITSWSRTKVGHTFPQTNPPIFHEICLTVQWRDPLTKEICTQTFCRWINCGGFEAPGFPGGGKKEVEVYPNPVHVPNALILQHETDVSGQATIELTDLQGRQVHHTIHPVVPGMNQFSIHTGTLPVGIYVLRMWQSGALLLNEKVIVLE